MSISIFSSKVAKIIILCRVYFRIILSLHDSPCQSCLVNVYS